MKMPLSTHSVNATPTAGSNMERPHHFGIEDQPDDIATAAYYKAEARGFLPDHELDDWLSAESELRS
jgi:hypothetical protein